MVGKNLPDHMGRMLDLSSLVIVISPATCAKKRKDYWNVRVTAAHLIILVDLRLVISK